MKTQNPLRILIAEDSPLASEIIQTMLDDLGHTVVGRAVNGLQAIEMSQTLQPDLVLMDISMPELDGLEATRRLQEHCARPVVLLTTLDDPEIISSASQSGAGAYLVKPPTPLAIERTMAIAMARFGDLLTLRRLNAELENALREIKTLQGIIPICMHCKKIRDDAGFWSQVEAYISKHFQARFSHGICPDCFKREYPDCCEE